MLLGDLNLAKAVGKYLFPTSLVYRRPKTPFSTRLSILVNVSCLIVCLSVSTSVVGQRSCLFVHLSVRPLLHMSAHLLIHLSEHLSVIPIRISLEIFITHLDAHLCILLLERYMPLDD